MTFADFLAKPPTGVIQYPAQILTTPALPVPTITAEVRAVCDLLCRYRREFHGAGLAAPQLGLPYRIVVIGGAPGFPDKVLINPAVLPLKRVTTAVGEEGCLSLKDLWVRVERPVRLKVSYRTFDRAGVETGKVEVFSGYKARVVAHELDHLDGVLIMDRTVDRELVAGVLAGPAWPGLTAAAGPVPGGRPSPEELPPCHT